VLGLVFAVGGVSAFFGAAFAERLGARWPAGPLMIAGLALSAAALFLPPLITGVSAVAIGLLLAQQLLGDGGAVVYQINDTVLRQTRAPQQALARVNAGIQAVTMLAMLIGRLGGGALAEAFDARTALFAASVWASLGVAVALVSPLRRLGRRQR
jgi:predicted MFS family arabinose efflux permease